MKETEDSLSGKFAHGTFAAAFFLGASPLEMDGIRLEDCKMPAYIFIISIAGLVVLIVALVHPSLLIGQSVGGSSKKAATYERKSKSIEKEPHKLSADFTALIDGITYEGQASRAEEEREDNAKQKAPREPTSIPGLAFPAAPGYTR